MLSNIGLDRETKNKVERAIEAFEKVGEELERLNDNIESSDAGQGSTQDGGDWPQQRESSR